MNNIFDHTIRSPLTPPLTYKERLEVQEYLKTIQVEGMRKHLCFNCAFSSLYDKNNVQYRLSRNYTLQQVKDVVDKIRKINNE